jgi:hypothetical protein
MVVENWHAVVDCGLVDHGVSGFDDMERSVLHLKLKKMTKKEKKEKNTS